MTEESITKLDAANRQLDLAIFLHFRNADPFGVHTLAGAAHRIFSDLIVRQTARKPNVPHRRQDVDRSNQPDLIRRINEARNFLKHADSDHDQVLTFEPDWTGYLIYDAIWMQMELAKVFPLSSQMFLVWLSAKYPGVPLLDGVPGLSDSLDSLKKIFPELLSRNTHKTVFLTCLEGQTPAAKRSG